MPLSTATTICGCVRALLPGETTFNGNLASRLGASEADIKEALETATALKEEGIVVKALDSPWLTNDRGSKGHVNWVKLKVGGRPCHLALSIWTPSETCRLELSSPHISASLPTSLAISQPDYMKNLEMDAVIIGGWCAHRAGAGMVMSRAMTQSFKS